MSFKPVCDCKKFSIIGGTETLTLQISFLWCDAWRFCPHCGKPAKEVDGDS